MKRMLGLFVMMLIPTVTLADVNMTTNIWADGNVDYTTNINNTGDTTIKINGVPWDYEPDKWTSGINVGMLGTISKYFYEPWILSQRDYNILYYLLDIINKAVMPSIQQLQYQNEAYRHMFEDIYGNNFKEKYCESMCRVGNEHNLAYVLCDDLYCYESSDEVWYCDKKINENVTIGVYKFVFKK